MYKLSSANTTYTIPLDSLDLIYLSRHFDNGSAKPMPLWRIPSREDYCEFKLNMWRVLDSDDEEEEADNLPSESLLCHLCNIHVPVIYINRHNSSERHINMKKILDLMVLRGKNSDLNHPSTDPKSESCFYCEDCSLVVSKTNSETHNQSYTHKKSLRNNNLIEQFLKFYSEDSSDDINNKISTQPVKDYFNKFINRKNLSFKINVVNVDSFKIIIDGNSLNIQKDNFHGLVETDTEIICILCEMQLSRVLKLIDQHIESKKHRKKVARNIEGKHCIREFNDDFSHCILCNELVLLTRVAGHKRLSYHTTNLNIAQGRKSNCDFNQNYIFSKGTEENSFRKYLKDELADIENICSEDSAEENEENHVSCNVHTDGSENDVCQDINVLYRACPYIGTQNSDNHVYKQFLSNENNTEESHIRRCIENIDINDQSTETDVQLCASVNPANLHDVENINKENINQPAEKPIVVDDVIQDIDTEQIEIADFVENIYYLVLETIVEKEVICKVCNVLMSNSDLNMYNHFNGDDHTNKYNELLKANRMTKAQNKFFCYSCKVSVTSKNEVEHIFGIRHRNKFPNDSDFGRVYCGFCKVYISDMVQEHQNSKEHLQACLSNGQNVQKNIFEDKSLDDTDIDNDDECIEVSDTESDVYASVAKTGNVFLKLHYHLARTSNPSEVLCKICDRTLPNSLVAIDTHIEGFYHANKYRRVLESNKLKMDGNRFYCKICDVFVTIKNELEHIAGVKHNSKLSEATETLKDDVQSSDDTDVDDVQNSEDEIAPASDEGHFLVQTSVGQEPNDDEIDDIDIQTKDDSDQASNAEATVVTAAKTETSPKLHYHVAKTSDPLKVRCRVCYIDLSNSVASINTHIQEFTHSYKYKQLLECNKLEKDDNRFHCSVCDVFISNQNEIEHIMGFKHNRKQKNGNIETFKDDVQTSDDTDNSNVQNSEGESAPASDDEIDDIDIQTKDESDQVSNAEATDAAKTKTSHVDFPKPHYHFAKTSNPAELLCKICKLVVSNSVVNIDRHIREITHAYKYIILLTSNELDKDGNRFHCKICGVFISDKNELEHIFGLKHKNKYETYIAGHCVYCKKDIPPSQMEEHLNTVEHLNMYVDIILESVGVAVYKFVE